MAEYYESMCDRYASMAEDYYRQSKELGNMPSLKEYLLPEATEAYVQHLANIETKTRLTISAIIFQALAIEAYVNLFGVYVVGERRFFSEYEPPKYKRQKGDKPLNTIDKLKKICKDEFHQHFPEQHADRIRKLFATRDKLVHSKPKPHVIIRKTFDYEQLEKNYEEMASIADEMTFFFDGIDDHMELYRMLQTDIQHIRGSEKELTIEISDRWLAEMGNAVREACATAYGTSGAQAE